MAQEVKEGHSCWGREVWAIPCRGLLMQYLISIFECNFDHSNNEMPPSVQFPVTLTILSKATHRTCQTSLWWQTKLLGLLREGGGGGDQSGVGDGRALWQTRSKWRPSFLSQPREIVKLPDELLDEHEDIGQRYKGCQGERGTAECWQERDGEWWCAFLLPLF